MEQRTVLICLDDWVGPHELDKRCQDTLMARALYDLQRTKDMLGITESSYGGKDE